MRASVYYEHICLCAFLSVCVCVCVLKCRICLSLSNVQVFLYRVHVCVHLFTIQTCYVYCCSHCVYTDMPLVVWLPHMNDERAMSAYLPLPSLLLLPFTSMMMLLPMNKVVQRTDRVLQSCATVVYFVLSFNKHFTTNGSMSSFSRSLIIRIIFFQIFCAISFCSNYFGVN